MISLTKIEEQLKEAMKAKNQLLVEVLRGLKTIVMNEQIAKQKELSESDVAALVKSEVKRRKEAAQTYEQGGRPELAQKELEELKILEQFLPPQMSEEELVGIVDSMISENNFTAKDFGRAMGSIKQKVGDAADGALISKLLKDKLK